MHMIAGLEERARELPAEIRAAAHAGDVDRWLHLRMELDALPLEISDARAAVLDAQAAENARRERDAVAEAEARIHNAEARVQTCRKRADEFRVAMPRDRDGRASERDKTRLAELQAAHREAVQALRHARIQGERVRRAPEPPAA